MRAPREEDAITPVEPTTAPEHVALAMEGLTDDNPIWAAFHLGQVAACLDAGAAPPPPGPSPLDRLKLEEVRACLVALGAIQGQLSGRAEAARPRFLELGDRTFNLDAIAVVTWQATADGLGRHYLAAKAMSLGGEIFLLGGADAEALHAALNPATTPPPSTPSESPT